MDIYLVDELVELIGCIAGAVLCILLLRAKLLQAPALATLVSMLLGGYVQLALLTVHFLRLAASPKTAPMWLTVVNLFAAHGSRVLFAIGMIWLAIVTGHWAATTQRKSSVPSPEETES